jgi:hypothetical protein
MNNLYDVLEICLNEIEQGMDLDTVLFRFPDFADELRPILATAIKAKGMAVPPPSDETVRRNRAKLLQHASEMRERNDVPVSRRAWSVPLRRALVMLTVVAILFAGSTNLVRAASTTLPGDSLYPVKRTWEDVLVFFTFDTAKRQTLELEHETERLEEVHGLFAEGRSATVDFAGYVTRQSGKEWRVSGITVFISSQTNMPDQQVSVGAAVHVTGQTQGVGGVNAQWIELLPADSKLPEVEDNGSEIEGEQSGNSNQTPEAPSADGSENELPQVVATKPPEPKVDVKDESISGVVTSIENTFVVVDGVVLDIRFADVNGTPYVGANANVEGYYDYSGVFIVTKIEFNNSDSGSGSGSNLGTDEKSGGNNINNNNDNNDENHNENENENHNGNYNGNRNGS